MNTVFTPGRACVHPRQQAPHPRQYRVPADGHTARSLQPMALGGTRGAASSCEGAVARPCPHCIDSRNSIDSECLLSRAIPSTLGNAQGHCSARRKFPVRQSASIQQQNRRRAHGRPSGIRLPKDRGIRICQRISRRQSACPPRGWRVSLVHWHQQHRRASGSECSGRHARLCRRIECIRRRLPRPPPSLPSRSRGSAVR